MAWFFGDGFDPYSVVADATAGYWDVNSNIFGGSGFTTGRFTGSRSLNFGSGQYLVKASNINDNIHHIVFAVNQTFGMGGTSLGPYFQLLDGTAAQCTVNCRSNGDIVLTSGGPTGATLATFVGAFPLANTWYAFEVEIVIHNTNGSFKLRKNGNSVDDLSVTGLNTRAGSANNYANKLQVGSYNVNGSAYIDDLLWRSDATSVPWVGDIRCSTRRPSSDISTQFTKGTTLTMQTSTNISSTNGNITANIIYWSPSPGFTAPCNGYVTAMSFNISVGATSNVIMALYQGGTTPGALLGTTNAVINPIAGANNLTFPTPILVSEGSTYYAAILCSVGFANIRNSGTASIQQYSLANSYASGFPVSPTGLTNSGNNSSFHSIQAIIGTPDNYALVNEVLQDGLTSHIYSSTPGHADLYNLPALTVQLNSVLGVVTRGYFTKSDAGTRTVAVQLKSGATTVQTPPSVLNVAQWQWAHRTDIINPDTGVAWTLAEANAIDIGPVITA